MIEHATVNAMLRTVENLGQAVYRRPTLSMKWALDPTTGKLAGRWVVEGSEVIESLEFASAA